jgi:hypothetical protein
MISVERIIEVEWTERERGWGQRPDGYTYHSTMEVANQFIKANWNSQPDRLGPVPDTYTSPSEPRTVFVDPVFALLVQGKGTLHTDKSHEIK